MRHSVVSQTIGILRTLWRSRELDTKTKVAFLESCAISPLLYASETWRYWTLDVV